MIRFFRFLLAVFFVVAGTAHFAFPAEYEAVMPPYLPWHRVLIAVSGLGEILGGVGLLIPLMRRPAGWGLLALLVAVFPANVYMLTGHIPVAGHHPSEWILWLRLPFQAVFMIWVWWVALTSAPRRDY